MPNSTRYCFKDCTFTGKEQSFAELEVGDAKQPDKFYPQVKLGRWDNEVNFSARLMHDEVAAATVLVADKVQWVGTKVEAHFYEVGEGKEEGGYEFEVILKEPPKSNVVTFTLQTKGLDFFYQPELTDEEVKSGCERPDNAVGSYAVYHQTMAGDYTALGGKNYRAGKAFHIYRPRIEEAEGNWVWGELNIDEKAGLLTVTIPQDFLDKSVYPVRHAAGLTFGYTTSGAKTLYNKVTFAGKFVSPDNGTVCSMSASLTKLSACKANLGIYNDNSGAIGTHVAHGTQADVTGGWQSFDVSGSIISGNAYWLDRQTSSMYNCGIKYDTATGSLASATNTYNEWPDNPTGITYTSNFNLSIYATYTPAATGQATAKRFGGVPHMAINKGVW